MKKSLPTTYAFIDSQNLNLGIKNDVFSSSGKRIYKGQQLDYRKLRHYLREKYNVSRAYLFIGLVPTNNSLYTYLQQCGFTLVFKTISTYMNEHGDTVTKGNVDTDIVLWSVGKLIGEYDDAVFVSGDGDFLSLYEYLHERTKLKKIMVPNRARYSKLLNTYRGTLVFVADIPQLLKPLDTQPIKSTKKTRSSDRITSLGQPGHGDKPIVAKSRTKGKGFNSSRKDKNNAK